MLKAVNLGKNFGRRTVFSSIEFELKTGDSIAITGDNGSGKTTLIKTLIQLIRPSKGEIIHLENDTPVDENRFRAVVSFVAPYLNLYDQLSGEENLKFFASVRGQEITGKEIEFILNKVGLSGRGLDLVSSYSTGMKQRLKYALALSHKPKVLFLDEPMSALDDSGKEIVKDLLESIRMECITVIATNEKEEYALARQQCRLGQ